MVARIVKFCKHLFSPLPAAPQPARVALVNWPDGRVSTIEVA